MSSSTRIPPCQSNSLMGNSHGWSALAVASSPLITALYGTSKVTEHPSSLLAPMERMSMPIYALSVGARATILSPGPATPKHLVTEDLIYAAHSPCLQYIDFSSSIVPHLPFSYSLPDHSAIFNWVSHPYNSDAFDFFLLKHGLSSDYPLLTLNLQYGFPLGHMPSLSDTVILPNNPSIVPHMDFIDEYLQKELLAGRMSGLFCRDRAHLMWPLPVLSSHHCHSALASWCTQQTLSLLASFKIYKDSCFHELAHSQRRFPNKIRPCLKGCTLGEHSSLCIFPIIFPSFYAPFCISCMGLLSTLVCYMQFKVFASLMHYLDICPHWSTSAASGQCIEHLSYLWQAHWVPVWLWQACGVPVSLWQACWVPVLLWWAHWVLVSL